MLLPRLLNAFEMVHTACLAAGGSQARARWKWATAMEQLPRRMAIGNVFVSQPEYRALPKYRAPVGQQRKRLDVALAIPFSNHR
jgi:hypothetical protein